MWKSIIVLSIVILMIIPGLSGARKPRSDMNTSNPKITKCVKDKECRFVLSGTATQEPKMSFLVYEKIWKTFRDKDKDDLRELLKKKIEEAREKPDKYMHTSRKNHSYDLMRVNVKNMRSYSVFLSYGKSRTGALQMDEEIMVNY